MRIYIYILLVFTLSSNAQNLVPNPSFETYTICPGSSGGQIESAVPWNAATPNSSTDYFNNCSSSFDAGVPKHPNGFQYARTGNAYAGLIFCAGSGAREYLQLQLSNPLIQNTAYYVEFYVNLASFNYSTASNNIAANFSITRPYTTTFGVLQPLTPHIINPGNPVINDTMNWVQVSGCYTAQGGEEYLTIGNFFDNANTQVGFTGASYYYVDDVRVEEIPGFCINGVNELNYNSMIKISPNPANDMLHIDIAGLQAENLVIKVSDILGREIFASDYKGELDISFLEKGVYFLSVYKAGQLLGTKKVIKE